MAIDPRVPFPCETVPEERPALRLLGLYPQHEDGFYMQRMKTPGGALTTAQWRGLARLAEEFTPGMPLHATTRQSIEFHKIPHDSVCALQRGIADLGLTCVGACGDTLRAVTTSPDNGLLAGTWDVAKVIQAVIQYAESLPFIRTLPRKFKVSISGNPAGETRPWINCIGLVANPSGTFQAMLAGNLGRNPSAGILWRDDLPADDILPLVRAILRLFNDEGDREKRTRARLRHIRERLGDAAFLERVGTLFCQEQSRLAELGPSVPRLSTLMSRVAATVPLQQRVVLPLGDIPSADVCRLADAVDAADAVIRLGIRHDLHIFGNQPVDLPESIGSLARRLSVVACPGVTLCTRGVANSRAAGRAILDSLPDELELNIAISGCVNNCPQAAVGDIGLIGTMKSISGQRVDCFRLLIGGGQGRSRQLGRGIHPAVPRAAVPEVISLLVARFREWRPNETATFEEFAAQAGDELEAELAARFSSA